MSKRGRQTQTRGSDMTRQETEPLMNLMWTGPSLTSPPPPSSWVKRQTTHQQCPQITVLQTVSMLMEILTILVWKWHVSSLRGSWSRACWNHPCNHLWAVDFCIKLGGKSSQGSSSKTLLCLNHILLRINHRTVCTDIERSQQNFSEQRSDHSPFPGLIPGLVPN